MKLNKNVTYNEVLKMWIKSKINIKIQSKLNYEFLINNYLNDIINYRIKDINKKLVVDLFNYYEQNSVAISTRKKLLYIIKSSLYFAYNNKYIKYIDLSSIKLKMFNKERFILSKEDQTIIESLLRKKHNIRSVCLLLCLYTGLRVGEVCGLKWEDIDFNNKSLTVKRTIERIKNNNIAVNTKTILIESTPKSDSSNRVVPIPNFLVDLLFNYKEDSNYYILYKGTKLYDPRLYEAYYARILKACNVNKNPFHTLRHTFATRSIESKMDIKTLSEILGHSQVETTLKLYVHPTYELKKNSIENLVEFMTN